MHVFAHFFSHVFRLSKNAIFETLFFEFCVHFALYGIHLNIFFTKEPNKIEKTGYFWSARREKNMQNEDAKNLLFKNILRFSFRGVSSEVCGGIDLTQKTRKNVFLRALFCHVLKRNFRNVIF